MVKLIFLLSLIVQQSGQPDHLTIYSEEQLIAEVSRVEFMEPLLPDTPLIDLEKVDFLMKDIEQQVYQQPIDARIDINGNIIPEEPGYSLNKQAFQNLFYSYFYSNKAASVNVPRQVLHPRVDSELLSQVRTKLLGQYVTFFNSQNKERSQNISLSAEAINNYVVFPGETFSFNKVVGKRTAERGYLPAPVIVKGELTEGIGGGICQVSSTLYNAVDRSGVQIVERYSHSKRVPYVPPGRDATVSWYGPDFTFKNSYNQPILIQARKLGGKLAIFIYSSEDVNYQPRKIPSASRTLPEEVESGSNIKQPKQQ
ncbi:VanW family protein [Mesobacillus harenae]|uniref:VanW family protein n=1 Tax=Mesobacillus harenae TaxID=2213203 RepID=UPI00157FDB5A|nr:VanW family protein [Mesobacillus harenae]